MTDPLDRLDRATLVMWRTGNVVGWSLLALAAGLLIHMTVDRLLSQALLPAGFAPVGGSDALRAIPVLAQGGVSVLVGIAVGGIIGAKVWRREVITAAIVAAGYVALTYLPFVSGLSGSAFLSVSSYGAVGSESLVTFASMLVRLLSVPLSMLWAARTVRTRLV